MPRLHILAPLHVEQKEENFICAFTGKAVRFAEMMTKEGWECIFYHNGDTDVTCCKTVQLLTHDDFLKERRKIEKDDTNYLNTNLYSSSLTAVSVDKAIDICKATVGHKDIFCHVFGNTYSALYQHFPKNLHVETGIGYNSSWAPYKIYETYAWMHTMNGKNSNTNPSYYDFVIPNYYRKEDWNLSEGQGYVLWGNRIQQDKGIRTLYEVAKAMPNIPFVVAGIGKLDEDIHRLKNVHYIGTVSLEKRKEIWSKAMCSMMPTTYTEPFGGFHIEAMLCGVPAVTSDHGCFSETVIPAVNGFRCKTLGDWIKAIELTKELDKKEIQELARGKYTYEVVGPMYTSAFFQLLDLYKNGWMEKKSFHYLESQIKLSKKYFLFEEAP